MKKLASLIAYKEGKKHQASIGDIREILSILADIEIQQPGLVLSELGKAIQARKKKR